MFTLNFTLNFTLTFTSLYSILSTQYSVVVPCASLGYNFQRNGHIGKRPPMRPSHGMRL